MGGLSVRLQSTQGQCRLSGPAWEARATPGQEDPVELVSRMMDGSIAYDSKARLEPVASGATVNQGDKIERLKEVPIFEGCSQRQLRSVARIARVFEAPAGTVLTRADELGDEFFLLLDGTASVEVAAEQ